MTVKFIKLCLAMVSLVASSQLLLPSVGSAQSANTLNPSRFVVSVEGDFLTFMRTNPRWSWAWYTQQIQFEQDPLVKLSQYTGLVGGDIKPDNVDIVFSKKKKKARIGLVDVDDGGYASLLGDVFHTLAYNEVWPLTISSEQAYDLYLLGLQGKKAKQVLRPLVQVIEDIQKILPEKDLSKKLLRMRNSEKYFLTELKLEKIEALKSDSQKKFLSAYHQIKIPIEFLGKIIFSGVRIKSSGGSVGVPRFTFLIQTLDGETQIIEAKYQPESAVAIAHPLQPDAQKRISDLINYYRPFDDPGSILDVAATDQGYFLIRERGLPVFDGGEIPKDAKLKKLYLEYVRHIFWWMGNRHLKINPRYAQTFVDQAPELKPAILNLVERHIFDSREEYLSTSKN